MAKPSVSENLSMHVAKRLEEGVPTPLGDLMRQAHQRLVATLDAALREAGWDDVRSSHVSVLATVHPEGSRLTSLAERGARTKQAVAELVAHLVHGGYLEVVADPTDGRAKLYRPTTPAYALLTTCERVVNDHADWLNEAVGTKAVAQLRHTLQAIIDSDYPAP